MKINGYQIIAEREVGNDERIIMGHREVSGSGTNGHEYVIARVTGPTILATSWSNGNYCHRLVPDAVTFFRSRASLASDSDI